jgi:hypothetical protein
VGCSGPPPNNRVGRTEQTPVEKRNIEFASDIKKSKNLKVTKRQTEKKNKDLGLRIRRTDKQR